MASQPTLIVIDFETTGKTPLEACSWQIGACAVRARKIVSEFDSDIRPVLDCFQAEHRAIVQKVSSLDAAGLLALLDAPKFSAVADNFQRWAHRVAGCRRARMEDECPHGFDTEGVCAHCFSIHPDAWERGIGYPWRVTSFNVGFDRFFFEEEGWGYNAQLKCEIPVEWQPCIMDVAAKAMGRTGPFNTKATRYGRVNSVPLKDALKRYEIVNSEAHTALSDTRAAAELAIKLGIE